MSTETETNPGLDDSGLDAFEARLLAELRRRVADGAPIDVKQNAVAEPAPTRRRPRLPVAAAATVAAVVVGAVLLGPRGGSPAYSVGEGNAEEIVAEIFRPEDSDGLERALEAHGIDADITYLPDLQRCAAGRYTPVDRRTTGLLLEVGGGELKVVLPPDTVRPGETFVLTWSARPMTTDELAEEYQASRQQFAEGSSEPGDSDRADRTILPPENGEVTSVHAEVAAGPVGPCVPVAWYDDQVPEE